MKNDDEITSWSIYRVAYSHDPNHRGWCVFEMDGTSLMYVDGPWLSEQDAKAEMRILNGHQGVNFDKKT